MFWKTLSSITRFSIAAQRTTTALGAALLIGIGIYDFLKERKKEKLNGKPTVKSSRKT